MRGSESPRTRLHALSQLARLYADLDPGRVGATLDEAIDLMPSVDVANPHGAVILAVLRRGDAAQRARVQPFLERLDLERVAPKLRADLRAALEAEGT